jgi:hypothetical protein
MHQQLWGYKVEWKSVSRGTGGKKFEYHCSTTHTHHVRLFTLINLSQLMEFYEQVNANG